MGIIPVKDSSVLILSFGGWSREVEDIPRLMYGANNRIKSQSCAWTKKSRFPLNLKTDSE